MNTPHSVIVSNGISHGGVVTDLTSAKPQTKVSVTVTPDEGYVLSSINVTDANGKINLTPSSPNASFGDVNYYTASNFSFTMRTADVTVSAEFMPKSDFYVTIPSTGNKELSIPEGTKSFKVYDEHYSTKDNGYLLLTAPQGFKMKVSGRAYIFRWSSILDYLELFDGTTNSSTSLGKFWESTNATDPNYTQKDGVGVPVNVTSSENKLLLYFYSDNSGYTEEGLNLTVTLIDARKSVEDLTITIPAQPYTGSAIEPEVTVMDGETTLTLGTDYEVSYSNNTNVGTATVTITGKGNYSGTVKKTFTITPKVTEFGALTLTEDQNGISAEIDGNYNESDVAYSLESDIENVSVTFNRTFTAGGTSTIVLPFDIEAGGYSGGDFYEFSDIDTKTWTATMSKVTSVKAHTPYLFVPSGESLTISPKVTLKAASSTTAATTAQNGWTFTGVYQKKVWNGNDGGNKDYCFAANSTSDGVNPGDFVKIGTYVQVRAFRCYLTNSTLAKAKTDLPEKITIRLIDETSSVVNPDDPDPLNPDDSGDITTPVSEITPNSGTKVWSYDRTIFIEAQSGTDYQIIDLSGRMLLSGTTNSTREEITLNRTVGIVIVKIGGKTFKVNY